MRFIEKPPNLAQIDRQREHIEQRVNKAAADINDAKTRQAHQRQRQDMTSAQLGGLTRAVKVKTGRSRDKRTGSPNAFGVIYVDDGDQSRAGQAIKAYSRGSTILPVRGDWLWFQTPAIRRTAKIPGESRRTRMTPERYRLLGNPLGKLQFARINPRLAKLFVEQVDVSVRTGLASLPGKRRSRTKVRSKRVTLFFGIKNTRRAKRYDPQNSVRQAHSEIPGAIAAALKAEFGK